MYSVSSIFEVRAGLVYHIFAQIALIVFPLMRGVIGVGIQGCYWCWYPGVLLVLLPDISIQDLQWVLDRVSSLLCDYHSPVRGRVCSSDSFLSCHVR